jgi:small subunit ribosomal protein S20
MLPASPTAWLERRDGAVSLAQLIQASHPAPKSRERVCNVANIKSQKKRILTNAKAAERNKAVKSELKTRTKNAVQAIGSDSGEESLRLAVKRLDMAAAKGVIHKNQAARRKSRLMKKINAAG